MFPLEVKMGGYTIVANDASDIEKIISSVLTPIQYVELHHRMAHKVRISSRFIKNTLELTEKQLSLFETLESQEK